MLFFRSSSFSLRKNGASMRLADKSSCPTDSDSEFRPAQVETTQKRTTDVNIQEGIESQTVRTLLDLWNSPDLDEDKFAELWACDKKRRHLEEDGIQCFTARELARALIQFRASFPDASFSYDSIETCGKTVTVLGFKRQGTHTGAPFYLIQNKASAIPATGLYCENDEEELSIELNDEGKIRRCQVVGLGARTGMAGFYEKIGGVLGLPTHATAA